MGQSAGFFTLASATCTLLMRRWPAARALNSIEIRSDRSGKKGEKTDVITSPPPQDYITNGGRIWQFCVFLSPSDLTWNARVQSGAKRLTATLWHFDGGMEKLNTPMISHLIYQNANARRINTTVYLLHRLFCWYRNCSKRRTGGVRGFSRLHIFLP